MPGPLLLPALQAAGQVVAGTVGAITQGAQNRKARNFAKEMYQRQREDSLSDWFMQNEYNSPQSQMARLREAGLNPNLVYGNGADNTAAAVRSSTPGSYSPKGVGDFGLGRGIDSLSNYYDYRMKQAQTDNLKTQNTVLLQEQLLKAAQTANLAQNTAKSKFDLDLASELKETSLQAATENVRRIKTGTDVMLQDNERKAAMNTTNITEALERIATMRLGRDATRQSMQTNKLQQSQINETINNLKYDGELKKLDIDLKKNGINPNDPIWMRVLGRLLNKYFPSLDLSAPEKSDPVEKSLEQEYPELF